MHCLSQNPSSESVLLAELDQVFGTNTSCSMGIDHIRRLKYMDLVIKETMRLHPPAVFLVQTSGERNARKAPRNPAWLGAVAGPWPSATNWLQPYGQ